MELYRQIVYISYWFFFCSMIYDCGRIARSVTSEGFGRRAGGGGGYMSILCSWRRRMSGNRLRDSAACARKRY